MEVFKAIKRRHSVRGFLSKKVEDEKLSKILSAASLAPSSGNIQNWNFIIVKDNVNKEVIAKACQQEFLLNAPVIIIVCNLKDKISALFKERAEFYSIQNCALAIENLLLAATALNLSTCFTAVFKEEAIKRKLNIPNNVSVDAVIALGYSNEETETKRIPLNLKTFFESYGNRKKPSIFPLFK
jgi:nitroreductase